MQSEVSGDAGRKSDTGIVGLIAIGFAGAEVVSLIAALVLERMGHRWHNLSTDFGWLVFDYGFILDVLAFVLAMIAMFIGPRNRRTGLFALATIALGFLILMLQ